MGGIEVRPGLCASKGWICPRVFVLRGEELLWRAAPLGDILVCMFPVAEDASVLSNCVPASLRCGETRLPRNGVLPPPSRFCWLVDCELGGVGGLGRSEAVRGPKSIAGGMVDCMGPIRGAGGLPEPSGTPVPPKLFGVVGRERGLAERD